MKVPRKVAKQVLNDINWYSPRVFKALCGVTIGVRKGQSLEEITKIIKG